MKTEIIDKSFGSIMVLVPHQDDEILMCAGIIEKAVRMGLDVKIVMVTNGDYGSSDYSIGRVRLRESIEGLEVLGLSRENCVILGYADTGMPREESFLWNLYQAEEDKIWKSHCSDRTYGLEEQEEFHYTVFGEHALYTRANCMADLKKVLEKYKPDNIFTTSEEDIHGDHSGLFLMVREIVRELQSGDYRPALYSGIVHSKAGDENWPMRTKEITPLDCPKDFDTFGVLKWEDRVVFEVPQDMKLLDLKCNKKAEALSKHVTALKPDAVDFLYSFVKADEIFWRI